MKAGEPIRRFVNNLTGETFELLVNGPELALFNVSRTFKSISARTIPVDEAVLREYYTEAASNARYATNDEVQRAYEVVSKRHKKSLEKLGSK